MLNIDHVILAVRDLDEAAARMLDTYGLNSVPGGTHEGWGTANRLVPIGDQYVELLAVERQESEHPFAQAVRAACAGGDSLMGVCCEVDDAAAVADRIGSTLVPGDRRLPDGRTVTWQLTGVEGALTRGLPFFIQWNEGRQIRTGAVPAQHRISPRGIVRVDVGGDPASLREWLGEETPSINATGGDPGVRSIVVDTPSGELVIDG